MYMVEGSENGFNSIPRSVYWAIVTLTTVGYGDIAPATALGQLIASAIMILGYAIIAIPTGIVGSEMMKCNKSIQILKFVQIVCETHIKMVQNFVIIVEINSMNKV